MTVTVGWVAELLASYRYMWRDEYDLHDGIERVLTGAGFVVHREVSVAPRSRIDLFLPGHRLGIEVKVNGSAETVARQLQRYTHSQELDALVLATTCARHRGLPDLLGGMPLAIAYLTHLS